MENKDPLALLHDALALFEESAAPSHKRDAVPFLRRLSRKYELQSLELFDQRLKLTHAESTLDREMLRDLAEFSQHEEIRTWAAEVLNARRLVRTLPFQRIQL